MTRTEYNQIQWEKYHRINENNIIERKCTQCDQWLEENTDNFYLMNKSKPEKGFTPWCKECNSKRQLNKYYNDGGITKQRTIKAAAIRYHTVESDKEIKLRNGERQRIEGYQSDWRRKNPEKCSIYTSLHRIHDITSSEEKALLEVFDYQCAYCGMTLEEHTKKFNQKLHNDHVDEDGYNDLRNDVPACKSCNCSKHESELEDWYFKQKFYDEDKYKKIVWWITEGYKDFIEDKPPYKIIRKQNEDKKTFHWELWIVDEMRNMIECIDIKGKRKELDLTLIHNENNIKI